MTYLVTGATGALGSLVVEQLIKSGERPPVFVRDADRAGSIYGSCVDAFAGDVAEVATLKPALRGVLSTWAEN